MYTEGNIIDEKIVPNFFKRHNISRLAARNIVHTLAHPKDMTPFISERIAFLKLCLGFIENPDEQHDKFLDSYMKNFFWYKTNFLKPVKITRDSLIKDIKKEISNTGKNKIQIELKKIVENKN